MCAQNAVLSEETALWMCATDGPGALAQIWRRSPFLMNPIQQAKLF